MCGCASEWWSVYLNIASTGGWPTEWRAAIWAVEPNTERSVWRHILHYFPGKQLSYLTELYLTHMPQHVSGSDAKRQIAIMWHTVFLFHWHIFSSHLSSMLHCWCISSACKNLTYHFFSSVRSIGHAYLAFFALSQTPAYTVELWIQG